MTSEEAKYLRAHPMKDKLDPKVLEAAWAMYLSGDRGRKGFCQAVRTAFDAADLVPRDGRDLSCIAKQRELIAVVLKERDEARTQVKALREILARAKKLVGAYNNELQRMGHTAEARQPTVAVLRDAKAVLTDTAPEEKE